MNQHPHQLNADSRIFVAGHRGLVGSALIRTLAGAGYRNIITRNHAELDLTEQAAVRDFFRSERPEFVILAAAKVGGIQANNTKRADFIYVNLAIQNNVIDAAYHNGVRRLLFLGSSCIYPRDCPQPMKEESLLTGPLEQTNEPYALAKISGIKMCEAYNSQYGTDFISVMPTNLYGPNDNFDLNDSHVVPALIRKFHEAKIAGRDQVVVWGSGRPLREFLYVDDMAEACLFVLERVSPEASRDRGVLLNVGMGTDVTISELAEAVRDVVGFKGDLVFDTSKPDGSLRKLLDVSRLKSLGWQAKVPLRDGLEQTYRWFVENQRDIRTNG